MKRLMLLACVMFFIVGCSDKIWTEQEVDFDSRIDCTYVIRTRLWYGKFFSLKPRQLERLSVFYNVSGEDLEKLKIEEMEKIIPYKEKLIEALKSDCGGVK